MQPLVLVPVDLVANGAPRAIESRKHLLPDTLLLENAKEPCADAILFLDIGRNELLLLPIVQAGLPKPTTLEDQAAVAA